MVKRILVLISAAVLLFSLGACKRKQEQSPFPHQIPQGADFSMPVGELKVVVPEDVKGWSGVVITIDDKAANTSKDVTIKLNSSYDIPGSKVKITIGDFLPDFKMDAGKITSVSNDPNNPAVAIKVEDSGKLIFPDPERGREWGFLYSKFPAIHPFQHDKYNLTLKEGVKGGKKG